MAKTNFQSVDEYIAGQPEAARSVLQHARGAIRKAVPQAEELISYGVPTYKLPGGPLLYLAGWKRHYSLYPVTGRIVASLSDDLATYQINKSTIRFPLTEPVPVKLIERIARFRAKEMGKREKAEVPGRTRPLRPGKDSD